MDNENTEITVAEEKTAKKTFWKRFTNPEDLKTAAWIFGIILGLLLIYNLAVFFFVFKPTFGRDDVPRSVESEIEFYAGEENYQNHMKDVEWFESQNAPLIEMTSFDGLKLKAYVLEAPSMEKAEGTVLMMHGFHSGPVREFATIAKFFHEKNYRVVLPYQRGHGLSEGKYLTFAVKERVDCRDWMLKINEIYGAEKPVFVLGISMGCATVTMAAGMENIPVNVCGFISDCGFTSPGEIIYWTMINDFGLPKFAARLLSYSGNKMANWFADFDFDEYSTDIALTRTTKPVLFITGTDDRTVPCAMTERNYLTYSMTLAGKGIDPSTVTKLVEYEGVPHAVSYLLQKEDYFKQLDDFVGKHKF